MRAIDVDKLKDLEELEYKYFRSPAAVPFYEADKVWKILEAAPTLTYADLVPHGRWISHEGYEECNLCHTKAMFEHNYCPNCGAKMN